jgi:hypothetical protein
MTRAVFAGLLAAALAGCGSSKHASACSLEGSVSFQGATGNLLGGFSVKNSGSGPCRLGEFPKLELFRADGKQVELSVHRGDRAFPQGRPVRVLRPGRRATAWIKWANYCGSLWNRPFTFRLTLTTGIQVSARSADAEKCQTNGGAPQAGPGRAEISLSGFH